MGVRSPRSPLVGDWAGAGSSARGVGDSTARLRTSAPVSRKTLSCPRSSPSRSPPSSSTTDRRPSGSRRRSLSSASDEAGLFCSSSPRSRPR